MIRLTVPHRADPTSDRGFTMQSPERALAAASNPSDSTSRAEARAHDIILIEAVAAIFKPQDSGFVKHRGSDGCPGIVQVVQGLLKSPTSPPAA